MFFPFVLIRKPRVRSELRAAAQCGTDSHGPTLHQFRSGGPPALQHVNTEKEESKATRRGCVCVQEVRTTFRGVILHSMGRKQHLRAESCNKCRRSLQSEAAGLQTGSEKEGKVSLWLHKHLISPPTAGCHDQNRNDFLSASALTSQEQSARAWRAPPLLPQAVGPDWSLCGLRGRGSEGADPHGGKRHRAESPAVSSLCVN